MPELKLRLLNRKSNRRMADLKFGHYTDWKGLPVGRFVLQVVRSGALGTRGLWVGNGVWLWVTMKVQPSGGAFFAYAEKARFCGRNTGGHMRKRWGFPGGGWFAPAALASRHCMWVLAMGICAAMLTPDASARDNKVMGEVKFQGASKVERDAGVWVDGEYLGFVKELKGDKKVLLVPGKHQIVVRSAGYTDFVQEVVVEPGVQQVVSVRLDLAPGAAVPRVTSMLKITVQPPRAAVFLDDKYVGHTGELGGSVHALLVTPGKHRVKIELPGYRTFETEVNLIAGQKSEVKTELVKGSIEQAGAEIKKSE
jgi:PEGA domain-containing protein